MPNQYGLQTSGSMPLPRSQEKGYQGSGIMVAFFLGILRETHLWPASVSECRGQPQPVGGLFDPFVQPVGTALLCGFADGGKFSFG